MPTIADAIQTVVATSDTTEKSLGTKTIYKPTTRITGIWVILGGAGLTTLEGVEGTFKVRGKGVSWADLILPLPCFNIVTSGATGLNPYIIPVDLPVSDGAVIEVLVTLGRALAINPDALWGYIGE